MFSQLFRKPLSTRNDIIKKKLESIEDAGEMYNTLYEEIKNVDMAQFALLTVQSQNKLPMLTHHPFDSYEKDKFKIPDANGKPQSDSSAFAFLCRNNLNVGVYVLTHKDFYELLHENDLWLIAESQHGDEIKDIIKADKALRATVHPGFVPYLDTKATRFEPC